MAKRKESDKLWWDFRYNWMFISGFMVVVLLLGAVTTWTNNLYYIPLGPLETGIAESIRQPLWAQIAATVLALEIAFIYLTVIYNFYIGKWSGFASPTSREVWGYRCVLLLLATLLIFVPYENYFTRWQFVFVYVVIVWTITSKPKSSFSAVVISTGISAILLYARYHDGIGEFFTIIISALAFGYFTTGYVINRGVFSELTRERALVRDQAITEERFRLARDLHDTVGHSMTQITLKAQLARKVLAREPERTADELAEIEQLSRALSAEIRRSIAGDVAPTLASELDRAAELLGAADITVRQEIDTSALLEQLDALFGWVVREGAMNILKHGSASLCEITLTRKADGLTLTIRDNGGPSSAEVIPGQGLTGLRQRAEECGGSLHWQRTDAGFALEVRVPTV